MPYMQTTPPVREGMGVMCCAICPGGYETMTAAVAMTVVVAALVVSGVSGGHGHSGGCGDNNGSGK
jgi:hypothetical protein